MIQRRKFVRSVSPVRAERLKVYRKMKREFLAKYDRCASCRRHLPLDLHHTCGRANALLIDSRWWLPLCRECHNDVTQAPFRSRERSLLCPLGHWNGPRSFEQPMIVFAERLEMLREMVRKNV